MHSVARGPMKALPFDPTNRFEYNRADQEASP